MYEALLKATPEYQKIAASFAQPGPAALFGLPPAGRALLYAALQKDLGRVLCIVTPGEAEATHFADDLKALGLSAAVFPPRDFMLRPVEGAGREYEYRRLSVLGSLAGGRLNAVCVPAEALLQYTVPRDEFLKNTLTLKPGMVYNREGLVARLFAAGYICVRTNWKMWKHSSPLMPCWLNRKRRTWRKSLKKKRVKRMRKARRPVRQRTVCAY